MKKFLLPARLLLSLLLAFANNVYSQVPGDFQSKNTTGNWSDFNAWNVFNGSVWIPATSGQIPKVTTNVFIQAAHTIAVDNADATCNDLNVNGAATSKISFPSAAGILNIKGNMILASKSHNCFDTWVPGAKIVFSGNGTQGFTNLSSTSVFSNIEVNKISGALSTSSNIRFGAFVLTAGNFIVGSGNEIQGNNATATLNINGGTWTQIVSTTRIYNAAMDANAPIGNVEINGGTMVLQTSTGSAGLNGFQFSSINVINNGVLTLNTFSGNITIANSINVDQTSTFNIGLNAIVLPSSVTFNGIINYNRAGVQTIPPATYSYLKLSGTGIKTLGTGTTTIPANGTLEMSGVATSPTLGLLGSLTVSPVATKLIYSSIAFQTAKSAEWNPNFQNIIINNPAGVSMANLSRTIQGTLTLVNGSLNIGAAGSLTLDGASLTKMDGFLTGTNTSDLMITGTTGGIVALPTADNISLRNLTIAGTRTLLMNGIHNISLNGLCNIGATAIFDNGGESQFTNSGGSIIINGKFINRDKDNFTGLNGAITTINPLLNPGSVVDFALAGNQVVSARTDYQNMIFSGSGVKTLANAFAPLKSVLITGNAIVKADHIFGDNGTPPYTDFSMDGGRLILNAISTQPCMTGNYLLTGGTIEFSNSQATVQAIRSKPYQNIEITGTNVRNSDGNILLNTGGNFTVKTGGIFEINDNSISGPGGTQKVLVESGAIFRSGNNQGFNGFSPALFNNSSIDKNITNIILSTGSTVEYTRNGDQPITNANGLIYQGLLITGSGKKTAPPGILTVQGNLGKAGTANFVHNSGTVLLNGSGPQEFAGLTYNNIILQNNTKSAAGSCVILDSIKVSAATTLSIRAGDTVTLRSGPSKTARMAILEGTINYNTSGKFIVERYIPARKAWRFLSVATNSGQTIKDAWQEGANVSSANPAPGFGTQLTSDRSSWAGDGFDLPSVSPSIKTYDAATNSYTGIASTNSALSAALGGYMTFIRGNRLSATVSSPATATILRSAGQLFTGSQPAIAVKSGKFTAVNNPFASPIDLRQLSRSWNVFYYVFDPNRGGGYGYGAFQSLAWNGNGYDVVPGNSGSYAAVNNIIESGQAFFVATLGADTLLALNESVKSASNNVLSFVPVTAPGAKLHTNLYVLDAAGNAVLADGVLHHFDAGFSNDLDGMDAAKMFNAGENISINKQGRLLAVERKQLPAKDDTLFFALAGTARGKYRLQLVLENLHQEGMEAWLEDNYRNIRTHLNWNDTSTIDFEINKDAATASPGRFHIIFREASGAPLPLTFTNVKAYPKNEDVVLEWKVEQEAGIRHYEIGHAVNGTDFTYYYAHPANNLAGSKYAWAHTQPVDGYNYYRIKSVGMDDKMQYSQVVKLLLPKNKNILVNAGMLRDGLIHLRFIDQPKGQYTLRIVNSSGQTVALHRVSHAGGTNSKRIPYARSLPHGSYTLLLTRPGNSTQCLVANY